ncbi:MULTISPECIES: hypothetical protein [unclassified Synechococcus]|uniref:hypothetical protein n=1 Tax=unclassified Synechococcus TaxID=2626047 RepID=UPI0018CCBBF4|nr:MULTISPECIES: hypothetical protein [unclassified Synechococcus]MEA5424258.1 hypothetical protein [Synechococcus sp. CCY9202]QPN66969.1 hypothetical protein H8F26_01275 [Synechococcus sp. CBW1006]
MSYVIDTTGQTYFFCDEEILSGGCNNVINVSGTTTVIGLAESGQGAIVEASFVCDDGPKVYDFQNAYCNPDDVDCRVNLDAIVSGDFEGPGQTILEAAGGRRDEQGNVIDNGQIPAGGFAYYLAGGNGNDSISGSQCNDFIRGNGGNDLINANAGDDLVRPGAGNDIIKLGAGKDNVFMTPDALIRPKGVIETNTIRDFNTAEDKLSFRGTMDEYVISGIGTKTLEVKYKDTTTLIVSGNNGTVFNSDDLSFIG